MKQLWTVLLPAIALFLVSLSCEDFGEGPPRIIPGVSIDGIRLRSSREDVERILGKPYWSVYADGAERSWKMYGYYPRGPGNQPSLNVGFLETPDDGWGPVDIISVGAGYEGKTKEGVGVGSHRNEVLRILGLPAKTVTGDSLAMDDYFCIQKSSMYFRYNDDTVQFIGLGPSIPLSFSPKCD